METADKLFKKKNKAEAHEVNVMGRKRDSFHCAALDSFPNHHVLRRQRAANARKRSEGTQESHIEEIPCWNDIFPPRQEVPVSLSR
jgi:hypothetical protein